MKEGLLEGMYALENEDVSYLDHYLKDEKGWPRPAPAKFLKEIPISHLQIWANRNAVYQIVTLELLSFLSEEIGSNSAIEIGAGNGMLCRWVGIQGTDSYVQADAKWIQAFYAMAGQPITTPPPEIAKFEALAAVEHYKPHTVVGAFITQLGTEEERNQGIACSMYGVNEMEMLKKIKKYICFGNKNTHNGKRIYQLPHREEHYDWLYSRAFDQSLNRVWIWENT